MKTERRQLQNPAGSRREGQSGQIERGGAAARVPAKPPTKVLIIDDSDTARAAIADVLTASGYHVFQLASAIGASRTIMRNQIRAVIVDVGMPGLPGDKLVRVLRNNIRTMQLVIIVISGATSTDLEGIRAEGAADAVLTKANVCMELGPLLARLLASTASGAAP
jgi:DNA-binding response OmpR family regulator